MKSELPKIYLINLDRSPDRLAFMEKQFKSSGLTYERVAAIDGECLTADELKRVAVADRLVEWPSLLTANAVGCAMAHCLAYRRFLEDGGPVGIFMEDDVQLLGDFAEVATACAKALPEGAAALLYFHGESHKFKRDTQIISDARSSLYEACSPWGAYTAGAYMISRETAAKILEFNTPVYTTADSWGVYHREGSIGSLWAVLPPVTAPAHFSSDIGYTQLGRLLRSLERISGPGVARLLRKLKPNRLIMRYELI